MNRRQFLEGAIALTALPKIASLGAPSPSTTDPFAILPASAWARARQNGLCMVSRDIPGRILREASIVDAGEPGQRLAVHGRVFAPDGITPAGGVVVYAYNTDAEGYYGANRTELPPRIRGWMKTDGAGAFELRTVFPGHYPNMRIPAHIHFTLWGGGYPLQWVDDLRFTGDTYLTREETSEDRDKGRFATIQPVVGGVCTFSIRLANECNFH
jgi:hypothetical protein